LTLALTLAAALGSSPAASVDAPPSGEARAVVLVLAEGAQAESAAELGRAFARDGVLVVRVDVEAHLARARGGRCLYLAGDLESIAQGAEKAAGLPEYLRPILVGSGLGASAAWAAVAEAPAGTFRAAVLAGLCPGRAIPATICKGSGPPARTVAGGQVVPPGPATAPLTILAGDSDDRCPPAAARAFAGSVQGSTYREVRGVAAPLGAGWVEALRATVAAVSLPPATSELPAAAEAVADLPLVEVPTSRPGNRLAVLLTGDGGWAGLDQGLGSALADAGVPVVALDSLKYFWKRRTPEETAAAVVRMIRHYRVAWGRDEVLLVGYSRGADLVSFLPPRMPEEVRRWVKLVAMLGPGTYAEFEVHALDLLSSPRREAALPVGPAVAALDDVPLLCVQGADEKDSLCPEIAGRPNVRGRVLPGGHHFDRDYGNLARLVLTAAASPAAPR
jgi:type IV secretory pathway VirJ component